MTQNYVKFNNKENFFSSRFELFGEKRGNKRSRVRDYDHQLHHERQRIDSDLREWISVHQAPDSRLENLLALCSVQVTGVSRHKKGEFRLN